LQFEGVQLVVADHLWKNLFFDRCGTELDPVDHAGVQDV
jgi:hypothetical protein